jgi:hypothetical protein
MRKARAADRAKGVTVAVPSTSIIRRTMEQSQMVLLPMEAGLKDWDNLIRTQITRGREWEASILIQDHKLLGAQSTTSTSRTPCRTFKTLSHLQVFAIKFKCRK